jgi:hypothetical protein
MHAPTHAALLFATNVKLAVMCWRTDFDIAVIVMEFSTPSLRAKQKLNTFIFYRNFAISQRDVL